MWCQGRWPHRPGGSQLLQENTFLGSLFDDDRSGRTVYYVERVMQVILYGSTVCLRTEKDSVIVLSCVIRPAEAD